MGFIAIQVGVALGEGAHGEEAAVAEIVAEFGQAPAEMNCTRQP